ncbi:MULTISPECIES: YetF domain-containing protein [unclassified Roseovarius]|uniref:YetF domain-containing protein n=1 Tax=unclassified Roseovarius TaxID=2614913 RepID=UPI00273D006D|nr:YetF domain-containing protein [Roseovarius sp. MMSF_3350]
MNAIAPHSQIVIRLVKGRTITFVHEAKVDWQALRSAHFGENHITESLRLKGLRDLSEFEEAHLERNGQVSVISKNHA